MTNNRQIKVGIIGAGLSARIFHAPFIVAKDFFILDSFLRQKSEKVSGFENVTVYVDFEEFIEKIDLVIVTTPSDQHYQNAKRSLQRGKHVVVEKPFTLTVEEGQELIDLANEKGLVLAVYHNRRWDGDFLTVERIVNQGTLGRIVEFESHFDRFRNYKKLNAWRESCENPGNGVLYDLGSHLLHQALVLFKLKEVVVSASLKNLRQLKECPNVTDYFSIILDAGDKIIILKASMLSKLPGYRFTVHGTGGSLLIPGLDPQEAQLIQGLNPTDENYGTSFSRKGVIHLDGQVEDEIDIEKGDYTQFYDNVADAIRDGAELSVSATEALNVIKLIIAVKQSSESGKSIKINF